jgi:glucose/mannose-6-phosphate isomerase
MSEQADMDGSAAAPPRLAYDVTPEQVARLDAGDLLGLVRGLGDQIAEGWRRGREALAVAPALDAPDGVVVCGMGGSAIGADVVRACLPHLTVPFEVVRGYALPGWASAATLVIVVSYSGNTEEALSCLAAAQERGCRPLCVASGGALEAAAAAGGLTCVKVPPGLQPRTAVGYLAMPVAAALGAAGLTREFSAQVEEAAALLRSMAAELDPAVPVAANAAKALAAGLHGRLTVVYGAGLTAVAARRWKGQINENAKALAFFAELPELDHNEIMGWTSEPGMAAQAAVVLLIDPAGDERLLRRAEFTAEYLRERVATVEVVSAGGGSALARVMSAIYFGDWVSFYLALLYGVDPTPVRAIEEFKRRLAGATRTQD